MRDFFHPFPEESLYGTETWHVGSIWKGHSRVNYRKGKVPGGVALIGVVAGHIGN